MDLDQRLLAWLAAHRTDLLTDLARALMAGGGARVLGVGLLVAFLVGIAIGQTAAIWITVAASGSASALATALKALVDRPRPPADLALVTVTGSSMPSTIAALTAGAAIALVVTLRVPHRVVRRIVAAVLTCAVVLVGAAMVYLGAHWASDVVVGWLLGAGMAVALAVPFLRLTRR